VVMMCFVYIIYLYLLLYKIRSSIRSLKRQYQ
jgi:hypothetical protein